MRFHVHLPGPFSVSMGGRARPASSPGCFGWTFAVIAVAVVAVLIARAIFSAFTAALPIIVLLLCLAVFVWMIRLLVVAARINKQAGRPWYSKIPKDEIPK